MGSLANISKITTVVLDVDGVLTDGRIIYGGGPDDIKFFNVVDGHRVKLALRAGLYVGILSGRASKANRTRANELGLSFVMEGCKSKLEGWNMLLRERNLMPEECLYVGDDVVDLPPMLRSGIAVAVANACPEVKKIADWVTPRHGGQGAVADVMEFLLKGQGKWEEIIRQYYL